MMPFKLVIKYIRENYLPSFLTRMIDLSLESPKDKKIRKEVVKYLEKNHGNDATKLGILNFLKKNSMKVYPYPFIYNYKKSKIVVKRNAIGFPYTIYNNKKLFFKKKMSDHEVRHAFYNLLIEQNEKSPHYYFSAIGEAKNYSTVLDCGAAEGIFGLHLIENVNHLILVEAESDWIEALRLTFEPFSHKVEIINKFVSDKDDVHCISIDSINKQKAINLIKIDVDGNEQKLISGANGTICSHYLKMIALCTYHANEDFEKYSKHFLDLGYKITHSDNYSLFYFDNNFKPPYLRRGLLFARRS